MAVVVKKAGDLVAAATAAQEKGATGVFLYLFGDLEEDSGESWCGDCADADKVIRSAVAAREGATLLECAVGDRDAYKGPGKETNEWRNLEAIGLTAIPTLIHWSDGAVQAKLVERECVDEAKVAALVSA